MLKVTNIRTEITEPEEAAYKRAQDVFAPYGILELHPIKKALDARRKSDIHYVWAFECRAEHEPEIPTRKNVTHTEDYTYVPPVCTNRKTPLVIVGAGPAGLFAALTAVRAGCPVILLERGKRVEERINDVDRFTHGGALDPESNVQFGEGGAGTFSDGKLTTGIKDKRVRHILDEFVRFGAPEEIKWLAKPHIGTDILRGVVENMRAEIIRMGGDVRFCSKLIDIVIKDGAVVGAVVDTAEGDYIIETDRIILAAGHSARDTFAMLKRRGVQMEPKPFSVGARIEHPQSLIGKAQYGDNYTLLPAADYKLAVHLPNGRGVYTFCMCPGGSVIASASELNSVVTNGMSCHARDGENANAALLVSVSPTDFSSSDPLAGIKLQRMIERRAYDVTGSYAAPCQTVGDFLKGVPSTKLGAVKPTYMPGVVPSDISRVLPEFVTSSMREGILLMDKRLKGFAMPDAVLTAPETRSSSPVRLVRDKDSMQLNIRGLFSAGEGGGHAGGITSSAADGIKAAEKAVCFGAQKA